MSVIRITLEPPGSAEADLDMTRVLFSTATFTTQVNGAPGDFFLQIKDLGHDETFVTGSVIRLYIDTVVRFGGYLLTAKRTWPFPVLDTTQDPQSVPRYWELRGTDWNILWGKRIVWDDADPTGHITKLYPLGTYDDTILDDILANYTDIMTVLAGTAIDRVGQAVLDIPSIMAGRNAPNGGAPWSAGDTLRDAFHAVARATGGIFYITPAAILTYCDADTATSARALSDQPTGTDVGYRLMKITDAGDSLCNDAFVWGAALGSDQIVFSRNQDAASILAHGRWQKAIYSAGLYKQASADLVASTMVDGTPASLRGAKDDKEAFVCTVNGALFGAAEKVNCISNVFGFERVLPVRKVTFTFPTPSEVFSELTLTYEIDEPWSIFESLWPTMPKFGGFSIPSVPALPPVAGCDCGITDMFTRTVAETTHLSNSGSTAASIGTSDAQMAYTGTLSDGGVGVAVDGSSLVVRGIWDTGTNVHAGSAALVLPVIVAMDHTAVHSFSFRLDSLPLNGSGVRIGIPGGAPSGVKIPNVYANPSGAGGATSYIAFTLTGADGTAIPNAWWAIDLTYTVSISDNGTSTTVSITDGTTTYSRTSATYTGPTIEDPTITVTWYTLLPFSFDDSVSIHIDDLDIPELTLCTAPQFDSFERTASGGWGTTTPSGYTWGGGIAGGGAVAYVAAGLGYIGLGTAGSAADLQNYVESADVDTMLGGDFTATFGMRWDRGPTIVAGNHIGCILRYSDTSGMFWRNVGNPTVGWSHAVLVNWAATDADTRIGVTTDIGDQETVPCTVSWSSEISLSINIDYLVKWERTGTTTRAKIWEATAEEPATWDIEATVTSDFTDPLGVITFNAYREGRPAIAQFIATSFIDFDYAGKPCYYSGGVPVYSGGSVVPVTGEVNESGSNITGTTVTASRSYLSGSVRLWVNGLERYRGTDFAETSPSTGVITLTTAIVASDTVRMTYIATGYVS